MIRVHHRVNQQAQLKRLEKNIGVEIDIRSSKGRLILAHDPYTSGEPLGRFLDVFAAERRDSLLILNPKEDGLEDDILRLLSRKKIKNFFFLDLTLPTTVRLAQSGEHRVALRVSEYEMIQSALTLRGKAEWIWLDCFSGRPPARAVIQTLRKHFKVCLVSPELEGYPPSRIKAFLPLASAVQAVCTKYPSLWR